MVSQVITRHRFPGQSLFRSILSRNTPVHLPGPLHRHQGPLMMGIIIWMAVGLWSTSGWSLSGKPAPVNGPIGLQPVVEHDFSKPIFLTGSPDQTTRLFVVEQDGRIVILTPGKRNPSLFLDISKKLSTGGERGLLGLAFHPQYSTNGRFFVNYTRPRDGATVIAEYQVSPDPDRADHQETIRLVIPQPYSNHNGGMIA